MIKIGYSAIILAVLAFFTLFFAAGCEEKPFWVENYGERTVIGVKVGDSGASVKFEFNPSTDSGQADGKNLSAIYWRRAASFGYLIDFRSGKLFIDAPSGIFFKSPSDFYENLERDVDFQKVKDSLTPEILREFREAIEKAASALGGKFFNSAAANLKEAEEIIGRVDLEVWRLAVDSEKEKIHALGLEYCLNETQAEKMLSKVDFNLTYWQIVGKRLKNQKRFVVCLGENHPEDADKIEAIRILEELRGLGFGYFLLECVLASDQKILDDYEPDCPPKRLALLEYFNKNGWGGQSANLGGRGSIAYVEIIDAAKNLGFKVIGIGNSQNDNIEFLRNNYWIALNAVEVLKSDPEAKIIVFSGATHAFPNYIPDSGAVLEGYLMRQDIPDIVKKMAGVESITFECIGGLKDIEFRGYLNPEKVLEKHIENRGWHDIRFFIPVPPEISTLSPEGEYYYIHTPQY